MKKILSLLLTLCLLLGVLPSQALAYVGDIISPGSTNVQTSTNNNSLVLQNDYIRVTLNRQTGILTTAPTAASDSPGQQKPYCEFITYDNGIGYNKKEITHPATLSLKSASFVEKTPNGDTKAIKAEYALTFELSGKSVSATTAVYYELVQCGENKSSADAWGVLTSVDNIKINANSFGDLNLATDMSAWWGYTLDGFSGMGHANATDGPAIKMSRTVVKNEAEDEISTESSVITSKVDDLDTWQSFSQGTDWCYNYITEVYVDGYAWANPFVGLSGYYKNKTIKAYLPDTVSVTPGNNPSSTRVECRNDIGYYFSGDESYPNSGRFLWGFRNLTKNAADVPSEPDKVEVSINAKRLAAFADGNDGVTVEYVADDAALNALKQRYGNPVALISGDYESKNGTDFAFTGGAALLSPSVTATWGNGGELVIHKDGTITHSGLSLNAPSFKFYQPNSGAGEELKIKLTQDGFLFEIAPEKNDAVIYVDIPYATAKLEKVTADAAGNLVFAGGISFQTVFEGASFTLKELGYGLNDKNEFTVNGVHATGSFDTAKTLSLELAKVEGEVNTFKGKEKYAFTLELNAFDLFETEAELVLVRSKKDGSLLPNTLYFFVSASPGIPLIPPVPIGQLNGGGAGFSNLADTVNGDYFAIPPLKLRGTLKGTYLHLIEGKGDVVIGPSEISLKASDVGIVGTNASIIDSFGYSLQLNGQERTYHGTTYKGIYFVGSETLELDLPSTEIDVFILDTSIELGAFGGTGTKNDTKHLYLGVGANAVVKSKVQVPSDVPVIGGWKLGSWDVDLIVGGQTEFPIEDVSVDEGMKNAFKKIDVYLGAMTGVYAGVIDARLWVLVPNIVETNFRRGGGWDVETKWFGRLPEWDWSEKGVEPVVQSMSSEDSGEDVPMLLAAEPVALAASGENSTTITVNAGTDETPYILLAFDKNITEDEIKQALSVTKSGETTPIQINWLGNSYEINSSYAINADTDIIHNKKDNKDYRVAILRLKEGGTYQVNPGSLTLDTQKSQGVSIAPFEELALSLNSNQVSGEIKYAEENTKYVLRTYFANEEGGADYLIDEQEVTDASKISVTIPQSGALAPSGEYYVTSFLMTKKSVESIDENGEKETLTGLVAIDHQQFNTQVSYQNQNQPTAPQTVTLELAGNEVMTAKWDKVDDAAGYAVTIYQKNGGKWIDTGFGYDLDKETTSINMALTVGGEETTKSKNLSANEAYKVGVRAYKEDAENEGGKYYSAETESADEGVYLPEYTPLKLTLSVNGTTCTADENGVYHAYIGGESNTLAVSCADDNSNATFKVTRMDKTTENEIAASQDGSYTIPDFEGSLMFKIDGISSVTGSSTAKDVTSVFLLVSVDKTAPVLTLSDPIFYADMTTGAYEITGTADAGSEILYGNDGKSVYASSDGTFTILGTLEYENSGVLSLYAQDAAGSKSDLQFALITKQEQYAVTVNGSYAQDSGAGSYAEGAMVTIRAGTRSGYQFSGWTSNSGVTFADASSATTTFTMPASAVTVTANWSSSGGSSSGDYDEPSWPVTAPDTENGSITVRPKNASKGDTVTITTKPDAGYELESMTVTDRNGKALGLTDKGDGIYTFKMPADKVEIKASFAPEKTAQDFFTDVPANSYYADAVLWAAKNGITGGIGNGLFGPNQPCTRAQIVTFLWRAAGSPAPKNTGTAFDDVKPGSFYEQAVAWAGENGITGGTGDGMFSPDATCTRAQSVTFLYRAAGSPAVSGSAEFGDVATNAYYADAVAWAAKNGITGGIGGGLFGSGNDCTRAQIVTFLYRNYQSK